MIDIADPFLFGGTGFGSLAGNPYNWFGASPGMAVSVQPEKVPSKPPVGIVDAGPTGQSGAAIAQASNSGLYGMAGWGGYAGYMPRRRVTVELILLALSDPIIAACHAYATGPIRVGKSHLVERDDAPEGAKEFIERVTTRLLPRYLEDAVWCVPFGWAGWQKEWAREDGDYVIRKLHACRQEWSGVLFDQTTGENVGLKWDGTDLYGQRQFILTYDRRGSKDYLGRSRIENVIEAWDNWREANNQTAKLSNKASGVVLNVGYPPGPNGDTTNRKLAESFAKRATSGASWITHPTWGGLGVEDLARFTPEQLVVMSNGTDWPMEALQMGEQGTAISALTGDKRYLDELKCLGYGVPPQAILSATTSNRATSEAAGGYGTAMNEVVNQAVYAAFNEHVIDALLVLKYGEKARGSIRRDPEPLEDPQALFDRTILQSAMSSSNEDVQRDVGERDWGAVYDRNGVPKLPEDEIAKRLKEKQDAAAKAMKDQQSMQMKPPGANGKPSAIGNGRMKAAEPVAAAEEN